MHPLREEPTDFPKELFVRPCPLIGFQGLELKTNATHKQIWDTFTINLRLEGVSILYKLIDNAHEFPAKKPIRNSYEWYVPRGILKKNWMDKHLFKLPALIVIFYELDWADPQFNDKVLECSSKIDSLRVALKGRNTKLCIVLLQTKASMPTGDDVMATEKASLLCTQCTINAKQLFVLPYGDHLQGYAVRLEKAFYEFCLIYYQEQMKIIKGHKEHLNKNNHQYLLLRHQFKMGFFNEMKHDEHVAHKHYTHAYENLLEIRIVDTNALEIRVIAGFIIYKLCRLKFALNFAREAISKFKAHTDRFKLRLGFQELTFEHYAWMSKQYSTFGDIFDEAVKLGLPAVQTQHPGLYYEQAVFYAILRKKSCKELCSSVDEYPSPDPLAEQSSLEFYGHRPWRPGKVTTEPPDPQMELNGIRALQFLEKQVNHSSLIIRLYGLAVTHYKTYKCPRARSHLFIQMADEYFASEDYGKALTLYTNMLLYYRTEQWWPILTNIIEKALTCAFLTAQSEDFVTLSLELLGKRTTSAYEMKKLVYQNLVRFLNRQSPIGDFCGMQETKHLWQKVLDQMSNLNLDMSNVVNCIDVKCRFVQSKYQADENVRVEIFVRNVCEFPMKFSQIKLNVKHATCMEEYSADATDFLFKCGDIKKLIVSFSPKLVDINKDIAIVSVDLRLGESQNIILKFSGDRNICSIPKELRHFKKSPDEHNFENLSSVLKVAIVPRKSLFQIKCDHAQPALLGEWYQIDVRLVNEESEAVSNMEFQVNLVDEESVEFTEFSRTAEWHVEKLPMIFEPGRPHAFRIFMRTHKLGQRSIAINASYLLNGQIPSLTELIVPVPIVKPFDVMTQFLTTQLADTAKLYVDEDFVVMPVITSASPWPLKIDSTALELDSNVVGRCSNRDCEVAGSEIGNGECVAEMFVAATDRRNDVGLAVGQYTVNWRRLDGHPASTTIAITGPTVDWIPLELNLKMPAFGVVRTPLLMDYQLINKSNTMVQLDISVEGSEAFLFAGYKQFHISVLPCSTKVLSYNLYPLMAGPMSLPKLILSLPENEGPALRQEQLNALVHRSLPTQIFVMPQ